MARPFHFAAGALTTVHQAVELALGTGVIGQAQLGLPAAIGASVIGFRPVAKQHFDWIAKEAKRNPAWWNRAWAQPSSVR
jgi:hypothetical protein